MEEIVGIDVGGSFIKWGRTNRSGQILQFDRIPTERQHPDRVIEKISALIRAEKGAERVGVSIPGIVSPAGQLITSGSILGLEGCQVKAELEAATGLPVTVVNDAHAAGLAEHWTGEGQDCAHFICITIGTAVGGAIFINGALYRGFRGAAGELSMIRMGPPLPGEKIPASASHLCGGILGLSRIYSRALGLIEPSTWLTDTWEILRRAEEGDAIAAASVEEFFEHLTILLINTTATLDPERILIGGGLSEREGFVAQVQARLAERIADTTLVAAPEVRACRNGNRAGILGAIHAAHLTA